MEGILVRALRIHETRPDPESTKTVGDAIQEAIADMRPSAHVDRLELMDLLAVKECTDSRFLPERFRRLDSAAINRRIGELRLLTGE